MNKEKGTFQICKNQQVSLKILTVDLLTRIKISNNKPGKFLLFYMISDVL